MRRFVAVAAIVAAFAGAGCAVAETATAPAAAPAAPAKTAAADPNDPDPIICQKEADSTSRLKRNKVCMHKSEWEARANQDQNSLHDARGVGINPSTGD